MKSLFSFSSFAALAALIAATGLASAQTKVCIDPGHGGSDPGAVGGGQQEATNVLDTGNRLKAWFDLDTADSAGGTTWNVIRTRSTDTTVELSTRTNFANSNAANRFMSIHNNAATAAATGIETFSATSGSATSQDLRNKVQQEAVLAWPLTNRGNKTANYFVIVNTSMPAELHEMGFISNTGDRTYLGSATQRDLHAKSELFAAQRNMGFAKYTPTNGFSAIIDNGSAGWSSSASWFPTTSTAGYFGANYHARATESVSDAATWTVSLPTSGSYKVDAWWTGGPNRAASAPYVVATAGGNVTVNKNQQVSGGSWQTLGTWTFNAGSNNVKLSCWTTVGFFVIGDAIRFTKV